MFGYPHFIPEFAQNTNSFLFRFKIANEFSEFRNYLKSAVSKSLDYRLLLCLIIHLIIPVAAI